jgi:outer membrane lipoprotein LolB
VKTRINALAIIVVSALISACAAPRMDAPVNENWQARRNVLATITTWEFTGRIGVRDEREAHSSRIRWRQHDDEYVINLWGALNVGATEITGSPTLVTLQQEGKEVLMAATPEQLVAEQLGYELPVAQLSYWIKGIPAPGSSGVPSFNEENHLIALLQDGWTVQYMAYTNYDTESLPTRIRIEKSPLRLDFVRLDWTLQP